MKIIIGLFLVATALAFPLAENEEKLPIQPIRPNEQSSVVPTLPQKLEDPLPAKDSSSESSSSESNESTEVKPAQPLSGAPASSEEKSGEVLASVPKPADKVEDPKAQPSAPLPSAAPDAAPTAAPAPLPAQIAAKSALPVAQPAALPSEPQEKPLALPTSVSQEKPLEEPLKATATEIKEEVVKPSEQKVEVNPVVEEKLPELQKVEKQPEPIAAQPTEETLLVREVPVVPKLAYPAEGVQLKAVPVEQVAAEIPAAKAATEQSIQIHTVTIPAPEKIQAIPVKQVQPAVDNIQVIPAAGAVAETKPESEKKAKSEDAPAEALAAEGVKPEAVEPQVSSSEAPVVIPVNRETAILLEEVAKPTLEAKPEQKPVEPKGEQQEILPKPSASSS